MNKVIIGVDGGGTKTLAVKWDTNGKELARYTADFSNFSVDSNKTIEHINEAISGVYNNEIVEKIVIGSAGAATKETELKLLNGLEEKYNTKAELVTDGFLALNSIPYKNNEDIMIVVGGTGSVVYITNHKETHLIGAYGHIIGDEGSAYNLVLEAIRFIIDDHQSNDKVGEFTTKFMKLMEFNEINDVKQIIYSNTKNFAASKAINVTKIALEGNEVAINLLKNQGIMLANQAILAINKINSKQVKIALRGGFILNAPYVKESFINELNKNNIKYELDETLIEPVLGAYAIAKNSER